MHQFTQINASVFQINVSIKKINAAIFFIAALIFFVSVTDIPRYEELIMTADIPSSIPYPPLPSYRRV